MISQLYQKFLDSKGISTDTRTLKEGQIFFALSGDNFDGNKFTAAALKKGAFIVVIDNPDYEYPGKTLLVEDTLKTLQELATYHRQQFDIPVIGLTGSNGKTTSKELMASVLSGHYKTHFTQGNLNNHIGVPLTLLSMPVDTEIAIIEMGANHQKEIDFLSKIAQPNIGTITNYGKAHLEGFGGVEGIVKGKSELIDYLNTVDGTFILNLDEPKMVSRASGLKTVSYSKVDQNADVFYEIIQGERVGVNWEGNKIISKLTGSYNAQNMAIAIAMGKHLDVPVEKIIAGLTNYIPENNRSQIYASEKNKIILDAYNANPSSMEVGIENFSQLEGDHKVLIMGDMFELGDYAHLEHQKMVDLAASKNFEKVIIIGKAYAGTQHSTPKFEAFQSTEETLIHLRKNKLEDKFILLKGSRGMKLETLLEVL